ncbi:unnamed protein product [Adineta steineri]|uniref:DUF4246 domain-containing protein n=1 Tax=Adineta steineri TaxID=433720 RepID=A0A814APE1_9BILA|nr:unnamed protein product [Adineta steineri]CAF0982695.1 unnamed protein product [Adineta steineri]
MAASTLSVVTDKHNFVPINPGILYEYQYKWFTIHMTDEETLQLLASDHRNRQSFPIEKYPCQVYLVDFESTNRIRVWLNQDEVDVEKCSDYMYDKYSFGRMKSCWVCKWIDWDDNWLIDTEEILDETAINKPNFYRLDGDNDVEFGDGGSASLVYPVWIHEQLPISEKRRKRLLNVLYQLNEERQDFHPSPSPVEDIIDPDLLPYRPVSIFDQNRWIERRKRQLNNTELKQRRFVRDLREGAYNDLSEHEKLRDTYQWVPSEFIIDKDGKVDIRTPIIHLPVLPEYRQSYGDIARIFHSMLPMFEKLKLINLKSNVSQKLQVIIKAQSYNLKAGMKYSGRWHTEGQTENIVAVGVYYLDIDEELEGGALKFRPKYSPQSSYAELETDHCISSIKTGMAVVFSNSIPHRFQQIRNLTTQEGRRRTFLNFFIVDPEQPIHLQSNEIIYAPKNFIIQILQKWREIGLPDIVIDNILKMLNLSSVWETKDLAKEFRARVRRAMLDEKTGWGWICWGNCGTTEFVRSLTVWPPRERDEALDQLHHTESD